MTLDNYSLFDNDYFELPFNMPLSPLPKVLVPVDGIQSGVPTLTTSTLTPTTLRSIEETFIQLTSDPPNVPFQAGFIPPAYTTPTNNLLSGNADSFSRNMQEYNDANDTDSEDSQNSWNGAPAGTEDNSMATTDTSSAATDTASFQNGLNGLGNNSLATSNASSSTNDFSAVIAAVSAKNGGAFGKHNLNNNTSISASNSTPSSGRRNRGGRRPDKPSNLTPEEEEKRRVRRERNKLAAARCRKRRVDQTNELLEEVAKLEKVREGLLKEVDKLNASKQELEYFFESHLPTCTYGTTNASNSSRQITGLDTTLASTVRSASPLDLKPIMLPGSMLELVIKNEPIDSALDSNSSLDHDGPPSPKRMLSSSNNPVMQASLPNMDVFQASLAAAHSASASLHTPIVSTAPMSFGSFVSNNATLNTLNSLKAGFVSKQRPNSLPTMPRNLGLNVQNKAPTDINGVAIQTPSAGVFNFDSLMDGGTGLTPVSAPLIPNCSSQNKHPMEISTPTSEPSKLVSL